MKITGIICEYNPLHLGHARQLTLLRQQTPDAGIVCLMSGNYVQRGAPAIFDKALRAAAAVDSGADLVLELPVTASVSSAENFAAEGVRILSGFCHSLSFGAETPDMDRLMDTAQALLSEVFPTLLQQELASGCSFPAARQKTIETMGLDGAVLSLPNNILAIEYCKAILSQNSNMKPEPIFRTGNYHDSVPDKDAPSATSLRQLITSGLPWLSYVPNSAEAHFRNAAVHTTANGERAVLARLRTMTDEEFEALPYGSEGLWRKLMKNARSLPTLEQILQATKSKRYARSRLDRMVLCALLGLSAQDLQKSAPYVRVLALNDRGRQILTTARQSGAFTNIGEYREHPWQQLENRCDDLYGLFAQPGPEPPGQTSNRRIYYKGE